MEEHLCKPRAGEEEKGRCLGLVSQTAYLVCFKASMRPYLKDQAEQNEE